MPDELRLELLGGLEARRGGVPLAGFRSRKTLALLAYLAVTGRPHRREALAGLLWGERAETAAHGNLRQALTNLRHLVGDHLDAGRATVAVRSDRLWLDVAVFRAALEPPRASPGEPADERLRRAAALYRGDLLAGLSVPDAPAFEEWLLGEREHLRLLAAAALQTLAERHAARAEHAAGAALLTRLLALEPWREEAHRLLMALLAASGQRSAALAQYAACRRVLVRELGIEPAAETTALYERIRSGAPVPLVPGGPPSAAGAGSGPGPWADAPAPPVPDLPSTLTAFVGRERELAAIGAKLADPACRLLTLVGPGGSGKTRLALQAAADQPLLFRDGVYVVPLASVEAPELIVPAIAAVLGVAPAGARDPAAALRRHLADKHLLLVLDNVEHLAAGVDGVLPLLAAAPGVKLLATSRERLGVQAEWLLPVGGLDVPAAATLAAAGAASAVRLFVARARQVQPGFVLSAETVADVVRLCRLVDGLPLGIELAAAWLRAYRCGEIADEVERSFDFLATGLRDVPARQRSLRAVFEHSWQRLSERERAVLCALAVCRGGCEPAAARAIAGATAAELAGLVDRSLLHRTAAGRYGLHELVRQYAAEHLARRPAAQAQAQARHGTHYAGFVATREAALQGAGQAAALAEIEVEIDNVRVAWDWAVAQGKAARLGQALDGLCLFYDLKGWLGEAEAAVGRAVAGLAQPDEAAASLPAERRRLLGRLLGWHGRLCLILGRHESARGELDRSLALLRPLGASPALVLSLNSRARLAASDGANAEARSLEHEAVAIGRAAGNRYVLSLALNHLGGIAFDTSDFVAARRWWEESLAVRREIGARNWLANDLSNLGEVALILGEYALARRRSEESLVIRRELGGGWHVVHPLDNLANLAWAEGDYAVARRLHAQCLAILREVGERRLLAVSLFNLAQVDLTTGEVAAAEAHVAEGLGIAEAMAYRRGAALGLAALGRLAQLQGEHALARERWQASLAIAQAVGERLVEGEALAGLGRRPARRATVRPPGRICRRR